MESKASQKEKNILIEGDSESVKLHYSGNGTVIVDIPSNPSKEITSDTSPTAADEDGYTRLEHLFALIDNEFEDEYNQVIGALDTSETENFDITGLNTRRSEMSILALILKIAKEGSKKTKLLYDANLSGKQLKNYLEFLTTVRCIEQINHPKKGAFFYTTAKGKIFLYQWLKLLSLLDNPM